MNPKKQPETSIVKTPHQKESYTEQQILEFARCADPVDWSCVFYG